MDFKVIPQNGICRVFTILVIFFTGPITGQLCQYGKWTTNFMNLNMDTTPIVGRNGMCSCKIIVDNDAKVTLIPSIMNSPNCNTGIELVETNFEFKCVNGKIDFTTTFPHSIDHQTGDILWLIVTTTVNIQQSLSGVLQLKSEQVTGGAPNPQISVECYEPNRNSTSPPTTIMSTTTTSTTTTTTPITTTIMPTTTKHTETSPLGQPTSQPAGITTRPSSIAAVTSTGHENTGTALKSTTTQSQASSVDPSSDHNGTGESTQSGVVTTPGVGSGTTDTSASNGNGFPAAVVAGGFFGGVAVTIIVLLGIWLIFRYRKSHQKDNTDIPVSDLHPTYSGLTTGDDNTVYGHIEKQQQDKDYYNLASTSDYQTVGTY